MAAPYEIHSRSLLWWACAQSHVFLRLPRAEPSKEGIFVLRLYCKSDYAGFQAVTIESGDVNGYYGYEVTDDEGNWCFELTTRRAVIVTYPFPSLLKAQMSDKWNQEFSQWDVFGCLMAGFALAVEDGHLKISAPV